MTPPHWHLTLRRRGAVQASGGEALPLGSKVAGLLAYLAVEGPTSRSTLAGLLWPEVTEATARNNLSQVLGRHRTLLDRGGPFVQLSADVDTDAYQAGDLLLDHDFGDAPDFMEWLVACRERFRQAQLAGCRDAVLSCEHRGDLPGALTLNTRLLSLDDLSEEAHRRQMRLHYLLGDRASALSAYHHCQAVLRRELGVAPLPETAQLASEIKRAAFPTRPPARAPLPLSVQRPPTLIGRAREWAAMQAAWDAGQHILLSGEPGVGKTRLMRDFVGSHGGALHFEGRPGDLNVPYSSQARTMTRLLESDLPLPTWVRPELARLLPELGEARPISDEAQWLRFYQAMTEVVRASVGSASLGRGPLIVAFDDLQFADPASLDAGQYILARLWGELGQDLHGIHCTRRGALSPKVQADLDVMMASGRLVQIEVLPLDELGVGALVESLEVAQLNGQGGLLHRVTGGNPLFVLETVRAWLEQEHTGEAGPVLAMPGGKTQQIITQRLARLSPEALKLARAAAVAQADFNPELAGQMLMRDPLDLGGAWSELERGYLLQGNRFAHDLIGEAVLAGLPDALSGLLHRRAAAGLEQQGGPPARIAAHWLAAGAELQALPHLLKAAEAAAAALQFDQAHGHYVHAAHLAQQQGQQPQAFGALQLARDQLINFGSSTEIGALLDDLEQLAVTPGQRVEVWLDRSQWHNQQGNGDAAVQATQAGLLEVAQVDCQTDAQGWTAALINNLACARYTQGDFQAAAEQFGRCLPLLKALNQEKELAEVYTNLGVVYDLLGRNADAAPMYELALPLARLHEPLQVVLLLNNLGVSRRMTGDLRGSVETLSQARLLLDDMSGVTEYSLPNYAHLAESARQMGQYDVALEQFQTASTLGEAHGYSPRWWLGGLSRTLMDLADYDASARLLDEAEALPDLSVKLRAQLRLHRAVLAHQRGQPCDELFREATAALHMSRPLQAEARVAWCQVLPPDEVIRVAGEVLTLARELGTYGLELAAQVRLAGALLAVGQAEDALDHAGAALRLSQDYANTYVTRTEVQDVWQRVLFALGHPGAQAALQSAVGTLREVAQQHVPEAYRAAFLWRHPLHRALLERAALADLETPARPTLPGHLTDAQWSGVHLLVAAQAAPGRPRSDDRSVLEGVLWKLATRRAWRELPPGTASFSTCHRRQQEWLRSGVLGAVLLALASDLDQHGGPGWLTGQPPTSWPLQTLGLLCAPAALNLWQGGAPELAAELTALERHLDPTQ
jgi:DNA-binding SARP family transcriptional activator/tetratricopeptide (TPR) repeat protein/transposase